MPSRRRRDDIPGHHFRIRHRARHRQGDRAVERPDPAHRAGRRWPVRRFQLLQPSRLQGVHALRPHPHGARLSSDHRHLHVVGAAARARDALHSRRYRRPERRAVSEAQREYGLTPDDVHDSFNLFMCTGVDQDGHAFMTRQTTRPGDHVDLLALMDVLAVPNVCGADVMKTSNFALKPLKLTVFAATEADLAQVPNVPKLASQRTPKDFRNPIIKSDRPLRRDPAYKAEFPNTPIVITELPIALEPDELAMFNAVKRADIYGDDDAAALRDVLFSWWEERFLRAHAGAPSIESK